MEMNMNNYPKSVLQTAWRRIRKPAPGFISENGIRKAGKQEKESDPSFPGPQGSCFPDSSPLHRHDPHRAPKITCRNDHKSTAVLTEIVHCCEQGNAMLPPSLLLQARKALRP